MCCLEPSSFLAADENELDDDDDAGSTQVGREGLDVLYLVVGNS